MGGITVVDALAEVLAEQRVSEVPEVGQVRGDVVLLLLRHNGQFFLNRFQSHTNFNLTGTRSKGKGITQGITQPHTVLTSQHVADLQMLTYTLKFRVVRVGNGLTIGEKSATRASMWNFMFSKRIDLGQMTRSLGQISGMRQAFARAHNKAIEKASPSEILTFVCTRLRDSERLASEKERLASENARLVSENEKLRAQSSGPQLFAKPDTSSLAAIMEALRVRNADSSSQRNSIIASSQKDNGMLAR